MKNPTSASGNQVLVKVATCLYRSAVSDNYYAIFKRAGRQVKRSLKTSDKELAKRRLESLRQKVVKLNTKAGGVLFETLAERWLDAVGGVMKPLSRRRRLTAIHQINPHFANSVRSIGSADVERWASVRALKTSARTFNIERETLIQILTQPAVHCRAL